MIQNSGAISQQFLTNLQLVQQQMASTQQQVSSGTKISQASDAPNSVGDVLQLESDLGRVNQVTSNLNLVSGQVNSAESALETATTLLDQVSSLAAQGAGSTVSAASRTTFSQQVGQILSSLVAASQTQFNGAYVFGGDQPTSPSYQVDLINTNGVDRLVTTQSTALIQDASGITFAASKTAQDIFDHRNPDDSLAGDNVFAAVNSLRIALANNDQPGIGAAIASIKTAQGYLSQQLAFYGGVQNQISNALDVAQKFQLQDKTSLGQEKDTDVAAASVALTQEQASYQAAIQAESAMPRTSLFDYLTSGS
jgi:flagellar hook-associated protein 3 FlgL